MIFLFLLTLTAAVLSNLCGWSLNHELFLISDLLQQSCLSRFQGLQSAALGEALVCGKNLDPGAWRLTFQNLNLYHVLVVSGAHLVVLTQILEWLPLPERLSQPWFRGLVLFTFALMTGLQPPVLRALMMLALADRGRPRLLNLMLSYLLCLIFDPNWIHSLSLHLSLLAGLGLIVARTNLGRAVLIPVLMLPLLLPLGLPSPGGFAAGFVLAPLLEVLLFPLMSLIALISPLGPILDPWLVAMMLAAAESTKSLPPLLLGPQLIDQNWTWAYCGVLCLSAFTLSRRKRQRQLAESSRAEEVYDV